MRSILAVSLGALAVFAAGCLDQVAGTTSTGNTGKGTIVGRVVGADGKGVANARVTVVGADNNPGPGGSGTVEAIVATEPDGSFRTDSLPDGYYNLIGSKSGLVSFVDSVGVGGDSGSRAGDSPLGDPGTVTGVVRLMPGHDSRTVFLILIGTTTFFVPGDSIGNFVLAGLAEGEYRLLALSTLDEYSPLETRIQVAAGRETALPDTLRLAYRDPSGLPVIDGPSLAYDPYLSSMRISWPGQDTDRVAAYHVYRRAADSGFVRITPAPVADTFFVDGWNRGLRPGRSYAYAVTALDSLGNEGLKGSATPILPLAPYTIDTVFTASDCIFWPCPSDIDPSGAIWFMSDHHIMKATKSAPNPGWAISKALDLELGQRLALGADDSGGIYVLVDQNSKLVKYDALGSRQWEYTLPDLYLDMEECFYVKRDTLIIWSQFWQTLTKLSLDGVLLSRDTVDFTPPPVPGPEVLYFDPGIGVVGVNRFMEIFPLDSSGKPTGHWSPSPHGILMDFAVDERGRWYLLWSEGLIEVYSAERELLQTIAVPENIARMKYRHGRLYAYAEWTFLRIGLGRDD